MRLAASGALCATLLTLILATAAHANTRQETLVQDDRTLLFSGPAVRQRALDQISALGADGIHSLVFWGRIAPAALSRHKPHFNATDPADYPAQAWDTYDDLVRSTRARGLKLLLTPTGAMPAWASRCHGRISLLQDCRPSPHEFGMFMVALAKRYSGSYHDENQGGGLLPRVRRWSVWNEPNQGGWLKPQYTRRQGHLVPAAPSIYRGLVRAAIHALRAHGHKHDQILLGETAPIGRTRGRPLTRPISPAPFYRDLFCINSHGHVLRGRAARRLAGCRRFHRLRVTGVAHHPYTRGGYQTPRNRGRHGWVTLSSVSRLERVLDHAAYRHRIRRAAPIWYTELGYQTRPPDPYGVSLRRQAAYINESNWLAYRTRRVRAVAQYQLFDEPERAVFNTGLRFAGGRDKPSLRAFRTPLWVTSSHHRVVVFGQVRPAAPGQVVRIQFRRRGHHYRTLARVRLRNPPGYFVRHFLPRRGYWRLAWTSAAGHTVLSRTARR